MLRIFIFCSALSLFTFFIPVLEKPLNFSGGDTHAHAGTIPPQELPSLAPLVEKISPAVVNIATKGMVEVKQNPLLRDPFFRRFFGDRIPQQQKETASVGSGVIVDSREGYIVTNSHVVANANEIVITLTDKRKLPATVIGSDPETDIAVLKVEPNELQEVTYANSDKLLVGDYVIAIGNPFGLGQTVTAGIVSALGRSGLGIESYEDFIQTDASINPGNSGGALVNLKGELVGINTAIIGPSGGNVGIGFAIPINMARQIMDQLIEHGEIQRGRIGVQIQDLTIELAEALGVNKEAGAVVSQVVPSSPAEKAGVITGDVIYEMNGEPVTGSSDLRNKVGVLRVGDKVDINVIRDGKELNIIMRVGTRENPVNISSNGQIPRLKGATFGAVPKNHPFYGEVEGVAVLQIDKGSPAASAGLIPGDIILSLNKIRVKSAERLIELTKKSKDGPLLFNLRRGNGAFFLLIR
ncbi:MAG: serine endoprotease DegQ [Rhodospirillaceae bacterium]|nr:serine endoprotease DegQ [Rhodospirillaceae bacterium]